MGKSVEMVYARHVGVAGGVHGDAGNRVIAAAAEVGGVDQGRAGGVQLRHEGVVREAILELSRVAWKGFAVGKLVE